MDQYNWVVQRWQSVPDATDKDLFPPCPSSSLKAPHALAAVNHSFMPTSPADAAMEASKRAPQEVQLGYEFECNYTHGCGLFVALVAERRKKK